MKFKSLFLLGVGFASSVIVAGIDTTTTDNLKNRANDSSALKLFGDEQKFEAVRANRNEQRLPLFVTKESVAINAFGLPVISLSGEKINYNQDDVGLQKAASQKLVKSATLQQDNIVTSFHGNTALKSEQSSIHPSIVFSSNAQSTNTFTKSFQLYTYGEGIGAFGMEVIDINQDGINEIIFGSALGWSIQQYNVADATYQIVFQVANKNNPTDTLKQVRVFNNIAENRQDIYTAYSSGLIQVFHGETLSLIQEFQSGLLNLQDFVIADLESDNSAELIVSNLTQTMVLSLTNFQEIALVQQGASQVRVGNVDHTPTNEIVLSSGFVYSLTSSGLELLWEYGEQFGDRIELGSTDDDVELEIIAVDTWSYYRSLDVVSKSTLWEETAFNTGAFRLIDVNADGVPEMIFGDAQWGKVHAHDIKTREKLWEVSNPSHGVTNLLVFDADGDSDLDVIWGAGFSSSAGDYLYHYDLTRAEMRFKSLDITGPFAAMASADLDGDGKNEIVFSSWESDSGYDDGILFVVDSETFAIKFQGDGNFFGGKPLTGIHHIELANVDDDPQLEVIVGTDYSYNGSIVVIDGLNYSIQAQYSFDSGSPLYAMSLSDVNQDGVLDILAGAGKVHSGSPGIYVYAIDGSDGSVFWHSNAITTSWSNTTDLISIDLNRDGNDSIVAVNKTISILSGLDGSIIRAIAGDYLSVATANIDSDPAIEIFATTSTGMVDVYDGESLTVQQSLPLCGGAIHGIKHYSEQSLLFTCGGKISLYDFSQNTIEWTEETGDLSLGVFNSLILNRETEPSYFSVGGQSSVFVFSNPRLNSAPVAEDSYYSVHWRHSLFAQLQATDADVDDSLTFQLLSEPGFGQVNLIDPTTGGFAFYPEAELGLTSFSFSASDSKVNSNHATVTIETTNTQPESRSDSLYVHWRGIQSFQLTALDRDDDPLIFDIESELNQGTIENLVPNNGQFDINANATELTSESFLFTVSDSVSQSESAQITVHYTNDTPVIQSEHFDVKVKRVLYGALSASDLNQDPLTYRLVESPRRGFINLNESTGEFEYYPRTRKATTDSFWVVVSDGMSESTPVEMTIRIYKR